MNSIKVATQKGFSAVELLITLFIASIFLFAGYQLYVQVTKDGADSDQIAKTSNIAYEKMKKQASTITAANPAGCNFTGANQDVVTEATVTYTITTTCPYGAAASADIFLISVRAYKPNPSGGSGYGPLILEHSFYAS